MTELINCGPMMSDLAEYVNRRVMPSFWQQGCIKIGSAKVRGGLHPSASAMRGRERGRSGDRACRNNRRCRKERGIRPGEPRGRRGGLPTAESAVGARPDSRRGASLAVTRQPRSGKKLVWSPTPASVSRTICPARSRPRLARCFWRRWLWRRYSQEWNSERGSVLMGVWAEHYFHHGKPRSCLEAKFQL